MKKMIFVALCFSLAIVLCSCSTPANDSVASNSIVGTWEIDAIYQYGTGTELPMKYLVFSQNADFTFHVSLNGEIVDFPYANWSAQGQDIPYESCTYVQNGNKLEITVPGMENFGRTQPVYVLEVEFQSPTAISIKDAGEQMDQLFGGSKGAAHVGVKK